MVKKSEDTVTYFDIIYERDGQTDGNRTTAEAALAYHRAAKTALIGIVMLKLTKETRSITRPICDNRAACTCFKLY